VKRFYEQVNIAPQESGFAIQLDGRPVKTPMKCRLVLPTEHLAQAVQQEWEAQSEKIDPHSMPLTRLANAALDRIEDERAAVIEQILRFCGTDLICYRADAPDSLVEAQAQAWDPILHWLKRDLDIHLPTAVGITPITLDSDVEAKFLKHLEGLGVFTLSGLGAIVSAAGSLCVGLGVLHGHINGEQAYLAASVDDRYQLDRWGADDDAEAQLKGREQDIKAAAVFLSLL
jgi:chaperone required for assembly of F1-ATPase